MTHQDVTRLQRYVLELGRNRFATPEDNGAGGRILTNSEMGVREISLYCKLDAEGESLMRSAMQQMNLSARGYHRVLKVSRTIADLENSDLIRVRHLAEALQYRIRT